MAQGGTRASQEDAGQMGTPVCPQQPDLGKTSLIKHPIELTDQMPFKEHYQQIPPICMMM